MYTTVWFQPKVRRNRKRAQGPADGSVAAQLVTKDLPEDLPNKQDGQTEPRHSQAQHHSLQGRVDGPIGTDQAVCGKGSAGDG